MRYGNKDTFALRLKIVDRIASIAATNSHWYQEVFFRHHPDTIYRESNAMLQAYYDIYTFPYHKLGGGCKPSEDFSSWRIKPFKRTIEIPSVGDCNHAAKVTSSHHWKRVPEDWVCPVCNRKKADTIRKNNKNEWSFTVANKLYRNVSTSGKTERVDICNDCGMVANNIGKEAVKNVGVQSDRYSIWVELSDIEAIIKPYSHSRHEIIPDIAARIVAKVVEIVEEEAGGSGA